MTDQPDIPASSHSPAGNMNAPDSQAARPASPFDRQSAGQRFDQVRERFDLAQLERTIAALRATLPEIKAREAEDTMRRMFDRARRWTA